MNEEKAYCCFLFKVNIQFAYDMLKGCMVAYNFLFMILSWCVIGLGIYAEIMRSKFTEYEHFLMTPSVILILIGCFMLFFSFTGFLGALRDNFFMLKMFTVCALLCVVLELAGGIYALFAKNDAKFFVNKYIAKGMTTYYDDPDLKNFVDFVQLEFQCCGGIYFKDWEVNRYHSCDAPGPAACGVPYSCCLPNDDDLVNSMCGYDVMQMPINEAVNTVYLKGCIDGVLDYLWNNLDTFGGILLGILLPQIGGVWLCMSYRLVLQQVVSNIQSKSSSRSHGQSLLT